MFVLHKELAGHSKDVRCLAVEKTGRIFSGSRDGSVRQWQLGQGQEKDYSAVLPDTDGGFITSLCTAEGEVMVGCQDGKIRIFSLDPALLRHTLEGHTGNVTKIAYDDVRGVVVSSSWDMTVRLWRKGKHLANLVGHTLACWSVAIVRLSDDSNDPLPSILSASADKAIILWKGGKELKKFESHTDCVRDIVVKSDDEFLSCGNDGNIIIWSISSGAVLRILKQTAYIYSICLLGPDIVASGGEDGALRVWSLESGNNESIDLPTQSCWTVAALPNGDVACGSSDGYVRIFTRDMERAAPPDHIAAYQATLEAYYDTIASKQEIGGIKVSDLPGPEALQSYGDRHGQTKMVREGKTVKLYEWSSESGEWKLVGDVLTGGEEAPQTPGKTMFKGKEYDYVIDVDVADGQPPLKLPYNRDMDPWNAAQTFIDENMLPQAYLQQVAEFIIQNVGKDNVGTNQANGDFDPLTGGSRYRPGEPAQSLAHGDGSAVADPFTGASRYTAAQGQRSNGMPPGAHDPLTGEGRYVPGVGQTDVPLRKKDLDPLRPDSTYVPVRELELFTAVNAKSFDKLQEFSAQATTKVSDSEMSVLKSSGTSDLIPIFEKLLTWKLDHFVPVLDILTPKLLQPEICAHFFTESSIGRFLDFVKSGNFAISLCTCRIMANSVSQPVGLRSVLVHVADVVRACGSFALSTPKASAHSAFGALLVNLAQVTANDVTKKDVFEVILGLIKEFLEDVSANFSDTMVLRMLQSLGTFMFGDRIVVNVGKTADGLKIVRQLKDKTANEDLKHLARTLENMLL